MNMNQRLSTNFPLHELCKSETAIREGIPNIPDETQFQNLKRVTQGVLQPVRDHYGIPFAPNSGLRCRELEKIVCARAMAIWLINNPGKTVEDYLDKKQHPKGDAVDFEIASIDNYDLAKYIEDNLEYDQLILECYIPGIPSSGWVHVSLKETGNRKQSLTFDGKRYMNGLIK